MFSPLVQWQEFTSLIVCAVGGLFASASVGIFRIHYPFITLYTTSFKLILGMVVLWALPHDVLLAEHDGPISNRRTDGRIWVWRSEILRSAGPTFLGDSFEALQTIHLKPDRYLRSANPPAKVGY